MPWVSIGASVGGSLISGAFGKKSSDKGAKKIAKAMEQANDLQMITQNDIKYSLMPFQQTGTEANSRLADLLGLSGPRGYAPKPTRGQVANEFAHQHYLNFGRGYSAKSSDMGGENAAIDAEYRRRLTDWEKGLEEYKAKNEGWENEIDGFGSLLENFTNEDFVKDPGYEFRLSEGEKGIDRAASSRGGYDSGSTLKALARYNQDYASNEFGNAYNRDAANKGRIYSFLSGTSNAGQGAATARAGFAANAANQTGANSMSGANQMANLEMQGANAWNNAIQGGIGNAIYGWERNKPVTGYGGYTYGSSGQTYGSGGTNPWYLS